MNPAELCALASPFLTETQLQQVQEDLDSGETLLALEFIADFLTDNGRPLPARLVDSLVAALVAMGSQRTEMPALRALRSM